MKIGQSVWGSLVRRLVVAVAAAAGLFVAAPSARATNVSGMITTNTSWTFINSPYVLVGDVVIMSGATLTIDPGVVVQFGSNMRLKAQTGTISAIGTSATGGHISFTSISDPPGMGIELDFPNSGNGIFTYCDFSNLTTAIQKNCCNNSGPPGAINNCTFTACTYGLSAYHGSVHGQVNNSTFSGNVYGVYYQGYCDFNSCIFQNNGTVGADVGGQCNFTLCTFQNNPIGIQSQTGQNCNLDRCTVINNSNVGIKGCDSILRCSIHNNGKGIQVQGAPSIQCCDIFSNTTYNVEMLGNQSVIEPNNWWGTTNTATINASIYDMADQVGLGSFNYTPILTGLQATTATCACTAPAVATQPPATLSKHPGQTATITAAITATGTPTYQWMHNNQPISGPRFTGVNTQTLTINPVADPGTESTWTDAGAYTLTATNVCGIITTNACVLSTPVCMADANGNGLVQVNDIFTFLAAWFAGCP